MKKQNPFQLFPRDILLYVAKKLADKDLGALRCDRLLDERLSPVFHQRITDSLTVEAVAAGSSHSLALMNNGQLLACGYNDFGQLGLGNRENRDKWTTVGGLNDSIGQIAAGWNHTVVLTTRGQLFACGSNQWGQLGLGESQDRKTLTPIEGLNEPVRWVIGGLYHTVVCTQGGQLLVCGWNQYGQLGLGEPQNQHRLIHIEGLLEPVIQGSGGNYHTVVLTANGQLSACGRNNFGQLGVGDTVNRETWVRLQGINESVKQVVAGGAHTIVLTKHGRLLVCGLNDHGQLGLNDDKSRDALTPVVGLPELDCVEAGGQHSLVVTKTGQCFACGYNETGQLGLGDRNNRPTFTRVQALESLRQVSAGNQHTLAITQRGQLLVCGRNYYGQLGLGDTQNRNELSPAQLHPKGFLFDWEALIAKRQEKTESIASEEHSDEKTSLFNGGL